MEYEYEGELESSYRASLIKSFKKQVDDGFFPFIIVDCINDQVSHFSEMANYAKKNDFEVSAMPSVVDGCNDVVLQPDSVYLYRYLLCFPLTIPCVVGVCGRAGGGPECVLSPQHPQPSPPAHRPHHCWLATHTLYIHPS